MAATLARANWAAPLVAHQVDLVAMAGFGTVMSQSLHDAFPRRILNTHPALLPAFPGLGAVDERLFEYMQRQFAGRVRRAA